jgi:ABC-type Fe3+-siderophore transport system permease subunit
MNSHDSKINTVPFLFVLFGVLLILFLILNITLGSVKIPLGEIWESFMQRGDPVFQTVIMQIRFPHTVAGPSRIFTWFPLIFCAGQKNLS